MQVQTINSVCMISAINVNIVDIMNNVSIYSDNVVMNSVFN